MSDQGLSPGGNVTRVSFLEFIGECIKCDDDVAEAVRARKDLRARYPKHAWPDNPLTARAEAKGRRKP